MTDMESSFAVLVVMLVVMGLACWFSKPWRTK